jgi:hypothetical protein
MLLLFLCDVGDPGSMTRCGFFDSSDYFRSKNRKKLTKPQRAGLSSIRGQRSKKKCLTSFIVHASY